MDFFFPDSQDQIDPSFDFERESSSPDRVRQRDDRYAHEVISPAPYTGMLLSKALVDGPGQQVHVRAAAPPLPPRRPRVLPTRRRDGPSPRDAGRLRRLHLRPRGGAAVLGRRGHRLLRGVRLRLRHLGRPRHPRLHPRRHRRRRAAARSAARVGRPAGADARVRGGVPAPSPRERSADFEPLGVAQGWSPTSYAHAVQVLQQIGYRLHRARRDGAAEDGGDPGLPGGDRRTSASPRRDFHLLGVTRTELVNEFEPLRRHELRQHLAVPAGVQGRPRQLLRASSASTSRSGCRRSTATTGSSDASSPASSIRTRAARLEQACLRRARRLRPRRMRRRGGTRRARRLRRLPRRAATDRASTERDARSDGRGSPARARSAQDVGIQVVIFRGTERNKRRGFHNLYVFNHRLHRGTRGAA